MSLITRQYNSEEVSSLAHLPDTQSQRDQRGVAIARAGLRKLILPTSITDIDGSRVNTVASFDLGVQVPAEQRGTHMSRLALFAHVLASDLELGDLETQTLSLLERLNANAATLSFEARWFVEKLAPVSGIRSTLDVDIAYKVRVFSWRPSTTDMTVRIPVTTLCPCSKSISKYGAHNQRSTVSVAMRLARPIAIQTIVDVVESQSSCPVYALLKREDEKYVTETAYENPKFAEDIVRDIQIALVNRVRPTRFEIETENHESIHNHAAYAVVTGSNRAV
jgi:GTP cyclohydrolase IB